MIWFHPLPVTNHKQSYQRRPTWKQSHLHPQRSWNVSVIQLQPPPHCSQGATLPTQGSGGRHDHPCLQNHGCRSQFWLCTLEAVLGLGLLCLKKKKALFTIASKPIILGNKLNKADKIPIHWKLYDTDERWKKTQTERYPTFMDWSNKYCQNSILPKEIYRFREQSLLEISVTFSKEIEVSQNAYGTTKKTE